MQSGGVAYRASDPQGHPRIRIGVDKDGEPSIVMLSAEGREVYRAAQ